MSQPEQPKRAGATFLWVLGAFAGFAVLFSLIQSMTSSKLGIDPRAEGRIANTAEIVKAQNENLAKIGFNDDAKKQAAFEKAVAAVAAKKPAASTQVVPGSPTQLKQAAAAAPAAPAPAPAPAAPATPAPAPAPAPPVQRTAASPAQDELTERVLAEVQRRVEQVLEDRLLQVLTPALLKLGESWATEARNELAATLREIVADAVADEMARRRDRG